LEAELESLGFLQAFMMSLIEWASWMKAIILICDLHLGHSKGSIS
jgi:hypothetical protein